MIFLRKRRRRSRRRQRLRRRSKDRRSGSWLRKLDSLTKRWRKSWRWIRPRKSRMNSEGKWKRKKLREEKQKRRRESKKRDSRLFKGKLRKRRRRESRKLRLRRPLMKLLDLQLSTKKNRLQRLNSLISKLPNLNKLKRKFNKKPSQSQLHK